MTHNHWNCFIDARISRHSYEAKGWLMVFSFAILLFRSFFCYLLKETCSSQSKESRPKHSWAGIRKNSFPTEKAFIFLLGAKTHLRFVTDPKAKWWGRLMPVSEFCLLLSICSSFFSYFGGTVSKFENFQLNWQKIKIVDVWLSNKERLLWPPK